MKVLVINAGSSSLKYQLIDMETEQVIAKGLCERIGQDVSVLIHKNDKDKKIEVECKMPTHKEAIKLVLDALVNKDHGSIKDMSEIEAVGHRVLHTGTDFDGSVLITKESLAKIEGNIDLGPLHMPANIMGIKGCMEVMGNVPMVAVFDTAFHSTMPPKAYMYGLKFEDFEKYKIKKYGFHGTSHKFVSHETAKYLGKKITDLKIVTCHLGNGSSISAVDRGKCIDTTMGFTPLEGLMMGTRSGDIDVAAVEFLMKKKDLDMPEVINYLNKECGMLGISEHSSDMRDLTEMAQKGDEKAQLAIDMFTYKVKKYIGSYAAAMGGVDAIVFTAGIGENSVNTRLNCVSGLEFMGAILDEKENNKYMSVNRTISTANSKVKILIIPTNEELVIARESVEIINEK